MNVSIKVGVVFLALAAGFYLNSGNKSTTTSQEVGKSVANLKWADCDGQGHKYFQVKEIKIIGDWAVNSTVHFRMESDVLQSFLHGATTLDIKYNFVSIYTFTQPIVPPMPYVPGTMFTEQDVPILQDVPIGLYNVILKFFDPNNTELQCINVSFRLF